ncbi:hypothetical protein RRG08_008317 [Elysia crispata]|uniref:Uncharacterized protein n=1 Tax=Elysia crispata TaxID=231223 RepID=A0AAE1DJH1_9GAST|nr:hypothetical protein RRG08_008317 [Elysia crispata]
MSDLSDLSAGERGASGVEFTRIYDWWKDWGPRVKHPALSNGNWSYVDVLEKSRDQFAVDDMRGDKSFFIHFIAHNSFTHQPIQLSHSAFHPFHTFIHQLIHLLIHFTHTLDRSLSVTQHLLTNSVFLTVINSLAHSPTHSFHSYTRPITFTHPAPSH